MLLTGLGLAYFRPQPAPTRTLTDNWKVFAQLQPDIHLELRSGGYIVRDGDGRRRLVGRYQNNSAHGAWTIYHANGRRAMTGQCREGIPVGRWLAWDADGNPAAEVTFGAVDELTSQLGGIKVKYPVAQSHREGAARFSTKGQLVGAGQFQHDQAEGTWQAAHGEAYRHGLRHDDLMTGSSGQLFLVGRQITNPQALLRDLATDLNSEDRQRQMAALAMLRVLGIGKVDDATICTALDRLSAAPDDELAISAVLVSYRLGQPGDASLRALLQRGVSGDHGRRINIAQRLALADKTVLAVLERELSGSSAEIRQYAFQILVVALHAAASPADQNQRRRLQILTEMITRAQTNSDPSVGHAATEVLELAQNGELRIIE